MRESGWSNESNLLYQIYKAVQKLGATLSNKLSKVTTVTSNKQVYGKNEDGSQIMFDIVQSVTGTPSESEIPSEKAIFDYSVPQTRTLTIGTETYDLSEDRVFTVSGGSDYLNFQSQRLFLTFTNVNEWLCSNAGFANAGYFGDASSCGSDPTPNSTLQTNALLLPIPMGCIVEEIVVNLNYKANNTTASTLEFFIERGETALGNQTAVGSNLLTICQDTLSTTTGSVSNVLIFKNLTINPHSIPSLAFSYLKIAIRETQNASFMGIILQIKFKKV